MTDNDARKVANVLMGGVVLGLAWYVAKTPPLRRLAWRLTLTAVTSTLPAWFTMELRRAWAESGRPRAI